MKIRETCKHGHPWVQGAVHCSVCRRIQSKTYDQRKMDAIAARNAMPQYKAVQLIDAWGDYVDARARFIKLLSAAIKTQGYRGAAGVLSLSLGKVQRLMRGSDI